MIELDEKEFKVIEDVLLSTIGAYQLLKVVGADKALAGYDHCLEKLGDAIAIAKSAHRKEIK